MFHRTVSCLRKAQITIPQLSPTHTRAKIMKWCLPGMESSTTSTTTTTTTTLSSSTIPKQQPVEDYDPLMILQCSADLITPGYRESEDHEPFMIVEVQEDGILSIDETIELNKWYPVGYKIGDIDDGDDDGDNENEWLWQAYSYSNDEQNEQ